MDEKQLQGYIDWAKNGKLLGEDAANYFKLSGLSGSDFDLAMSQMPTEYEVSQPTPDLAPDPQEQKKEEVDPLAGFVPMKQDEGRGQFDVDLGFIEGSILEKSEEEAVGVLRNKYNRYGFEFSEAVPGFDYINVKAPNGEEQKFVFGRELFESEKQYYPNHEKSLAAGAQDLVSFMNANMIEDVDKINDLAKTNFLDTPGYTSKEDIQKDQKALEERAKNLQSEITAYQELADSYNSVLLSGNQEEADRISSEVRDMTKDLENKRAELEQDNRTFEANYGRWFSTKANQGTWIGTALNWLGGGFDNIVNGYVNEFMDAPYLSPQAYAMGRGISIADAMAGRKLTDEEREARKIDYKGFEEIVKRFSGTTDEYVDQLERKIQAIPNPMTRMTAQGVEGLIKSAPAFLSPGKWLRMANMTSMILNDLSEEMSGEEFDGVTEDEKWLLKAPMALTTAVLEEIGFRNATQVKAIAPGVLGRVLGKTKAGSKLAPKTLAEYIEQDVKNSIARGGLTLGAAFLAEAETGALQEVADIELKRLWDLAKDRTDFDAPSTTSEYFSRVASAAYMEGVGGFVLGSRSAYRSAKNPFKDGDLADMMILSSEDVVEAREIFREREVALGKMSKADAQDQNRIERRIHEVAKQVPADASVSVQKQIFRKLQKEAGLKDAVAKKGARMAAREQSDLNEVRKELEDIANNYDRMTPEQKAKEMREITQPITPTGGVFVETADGSTIEISAEDVSPQEQQQNDSMDEGPELQEGVQLSLFDETSAPRPCRRLVSLLSISHL